MIRLVLNSMLYFPAREIIETPDRAGLDYVHSGLSEQAGGRRAGVAVGALLARPAAAAAVAAIVEQQHVESDACQQGGMKDAVPNVAGVSAAEQQMAERGRPRVDPPAVKVLAVIGLDRQLAANYSRSPAASRASCGLK